MRLLLALWWALALAACGSEDPSAALDSGVEAAADAVDDLEPETSFDADPAADSADADTETADPSPDAGDVDVDVAETLPETTSDRGPVEPDPGTDGAPELPDVGPMPTKTAWGPISGACGALGEALASAEPSFAVSTWDLEVAFDAGLLDEGPAQRFSQPNAGGSSKCSEVMSMQWLIECEGAQIHKLETEITYDVEGALTDYAVLVAEETIGVSVTRAYLGPVTTTYSLGAATELLTKKLQQVNESSANVSAADAWAKQILHVWTLQPTWVPFLEEAWEGLSDDLRADTVVLVTIEAGTDYVVTDSCDD